MFSSTQQNSQFYATKRCYTPNEGNRLADMRSYETTERKTNENMRITLKKPIQTLLDEGFLVKGSQEAPKKSINYGEKYGVSKSIEPASLKAKKKNAEVSTKSRIEELIFDSKLLITQGSKFLSEGKDHHNQRVSYLKPKYEESTMNKTVSKGFGKFENEFEDQETPKKRDAFKEFQRLENKLKELETKISVLKNRRIEHSSSRQCFNPSEELNNRHYYQQEEHNIERNFKFPVDYAGMLQNIVTQVQPHSILPKNNLINPRFNEKFQNNTNYTMKYGKLSLLQRFDNHRYYLDSVIQAYMNPQSENRESWIDHFWQTMQCIGFIKGLERTPAYILREKLITLPKMQNYWRKKTLIFDLDETLVHCNESLDKPCDAVLTFNFGNNVEIEAGINLRPFARECLKELAQHYELIVFTASHESYASSVVNYLDPNHEFIQHHLSRESCFLTNDGLFIKDLRVIGNRNLEEMLIIDNAAYSFAFQLDNGVPILPFYNDRNDKELLRVTEYLIGLEHCDDLRRMNREYFKLERFSEFKDPLELLITVFKAIT